MAKRSKIERKQAPNCVGSQVPSASVIVMPSTAAHAGICASSGCRGFVFESSRTEVSFQECGRRVGEVGESDAAIRREARCSKAEAELTQSAGYSEDRLQVHQHAAHVHLGSGKGPIPQCHRPIGSRTARDGDGDQERPGDGTAAVSISTPTPRIEVTRAAVDTDWAPHTSKAFTLVVCTGCKVGEMK